MKLSPPLSAFGEATPADCPKSSGIIVPALIGALAAWAIPHVMTAVLASLKGEGGSDDVEIDVEP